jgi:cob(I)alamin adenosyltransferase
MTKNQGPDTEDEHRERMRALQTEMRAAIREAKDRRGLLIVHTGDGKGKTTAAFGMLARSLAHGQRCAVIQFIKSGSDAVERLFRGPLLSWHRVGEGFTWDTQSRAKDIAGCEEGWKLAVGYLKSPETDFLLLDELNVVLDFDYLPKEEVLAALRAKWAEQHVVVTGRNACPEIIGLADLVRDEGDQAPFQVGREGAGWN